MAKNVTDRDIDRVMRQLAGVVNERKVWEDLGKSHLRTIVTSMLSTAKAGIGPGNQPYDPYAPSYQKAIARAGEEATKKWLVGLGRKGQKTTRGGYSKTLGGPTKVGGQAGAMLDGKNFSVEPPKSDGPAHMVWQDKGGQGVLVYAQVHQGTAYGGKDHTRGQIPPRPFMHFENAQNARALFLALKATMDARVARVRNLGPDGAAVLRKIAG